MYMQCFSHGAFLFFLGHGDSTDKNVPTLVRDITGVGQVACGSSHTIAVSQDGRTVWSFGGGDNGEGLYTEKTIEIHLIRLTEVYCKVLSEKNAKSLLKQHCYCPMLLMRTTKTAVCLQTRAIFHHLYGF